MSSKKPVSANLVGQVERCPYAASRDRQGAKISKAHHQLREQGNQFHNRINDECKSYNRTSYLKVIVIVLVMIVGVLLWFS
ncbi:MULTISPECIES: hypothetical protein [Vibrio]|uniref:hypothetical protein n=1 Tax=Vibrio TaxID=662 RepID=UPI001E2A9449|nr:hypothetical protein [Vibrio lentus]MCC4837980.1 hypothetical protein [Vibrio lentus]